MCRRNKADGGVGKRRGRPDRKEQRTLGREAVCWGFDGAWAKDGLDELSRQDFGVERIEWMNCG